MEQNLPLVQFGPADKGYNGWIIPFLGKMDEGRVFKFLVNGGLQLLGLGFLVIGILYTALKLFGEYGFLENVINAEGISGAKLAGAIAGMVIGILLSILTSWILYSVVRKRAEIGRAHV